MMKSTREPGRSFEETYPRYAFAELVRWAVMLGAWMGRLHKPTAPTKAARSRSRRPPGALPIVRIPPLPQRRIETGSGAVESGVPKLNRDTRKSA